MTGFNSVQFGDLFDALSHAGVHEIEPADGNDGSIIVVSRNGEHVGVIGQYVTDANQWSFSINGHLLHGVGVNALLDAIKEQRKY